MFRPATALSVVLLAAFVLLLLSVLSAPIIPAITIASLGNTRFGVFGYCNNNNCTDVVLGYNVDSSTSFSLPSNARNSLTKLLVVHPVAALLTLGLFILSVLAHFHGPGHSPKYLLACLLMTLPTLVVTLLAFLVDILIFIPHVGWGGWIVLGATILVAISGVVMCGMRRSIVGRLARSKRIQENAEMNGQNYFNTRHSMPPPAQDKLPEFATFEVNKNGGPEGERIPLNPRSRTVSPPPAEDQGFTRSNTLKTEGSDKSIGSYGPPPRGSGPLGPNLAGPPPRGLGQVRNQYSDNTLQTSTSGGSAGPYGPPQPARGTPYGRPPPPNQGYPGPPSMGPGGYGPNPERYGSPAAGGFRGPPQGGPGGFNPRRGPPPPGAYGPGPGPQQRGGPGGYGPPNGAGGYYPPQQYGPPPRGGGPPMMPIGGPGPRQMMSNPPPQPYHEYPADIDAPSNERQEFEQTLAPVNAGVIGVATSDEGLPHDENRPPQELPAAVPGGSPVYSEPTAHSSSGRLQVVNEAPGGHEDGYVPPRAQWNQNRTGTPPTNPSPNRSPRPASPVELPTQQASTSRPTSLRSGRQSGSYYEDVAPEFDASHELPPPLPSTSPHPPALTPGPTHLSAGPWSPPPIPDDIDDGQRSPGAMSTGSNFTSISQRGINPRWQQAQVEQAGRGRVKSVGLAGNPDFELPAVVRGRGAAPRGGGLPRGGFR